jgi:hypothetical protein
MQPSPTNLTQAAHNSKPGRRVLAAQVCAFGAAALAVAILAGSVLAASGNLVKNGSFEKDGNGDGIPNGWTPSSLTPADKRVCNQSTAGSCSFKMVGDGTTKVLQQEILISGPAFDVFNFSAWTKGKIIDLGAGTVTIYVQINYTDFGHAESHLLMPTGTSPWTLRQIQVEALQDYDSIQIFVYTSSNSGKAWVDGVKLIPAP